MLRGCCSTLRVYNPDVLHNINFPICFPCVNLSCAASMNDLGGREVSQTNYELNPSMSVLTAWCFAQQKPGSFATAQ